MGTGVGEAMLLGAAMGGGSAAITGGDPLKGALIGGLTGGAGAGISGGLSALAPEATTLAGSALTAAPTATQVGTQLGVQGAATGLGSQSAMLADQIAGFGPQGIASLQGAAQAAIPAGTLPSTAMTAVGAPVAQTAIPSAGGTFTEGMAKFANSPLTSIKGNMGLSAASGLAGAIGGREELKGPEEYDGPLKRFKFNPDSYRPAMYAEGGIANLAGGGYDRMVGEQPMYMSNMARGGISDLGGYSDYARGGRMLKGPGDGMSDSIPASIAGKRPARLANEEFVVPADVVSHLGNGSSDAGAKQLYAMMDRVRTARTGRKSQGREIRPQKYMAA